MYKDVEGKLGWIPDTNGLPVAKRLAETPVMQSTKASVDVESR